MRYKHLPLNEDAEFVAGSYAVVEEARVPYGGRELMAIVKETSEIVTCGPDGCGVPYPSVRAVAVPGFIVRWKYETEGGLAVSEVEPVGDDTELRIAIEELVVARFQADMVEFE